MGAMLFEGSGKTYSYKSSTGERDVTITFKGQWRTKLFLVAGLLGMFLIVALCIGGYRVTVKAISLHLLEVHNVALAAAVARELKTEFAAILDVSRTLNEADVEAIAAAVITANEYRLHALLEDAHVHYFDIHDLSGRAIYTSHPDAVGSSHEDDDYFDAARSGIVTNYLDDKPADAGGASEPHVHLVTFAPIYGPAGTPPLAVLGLYAVADPGVIPYPMVKPLLATSFSAAPLLLLLMGGFYTYRRVKEGQPLIGPRRHGEDGESVVRCHTIAAQETERKRISRDLHDGIGQYLNAIKIHLQHIATSKEDRLSSDACDEIKDVVRVVTTASDEVRRISLALRPTMLDDLGLVATMSWLCREFVLLHQNIALHKRVEVDEESIPDELKTAIYRILQEALTNVAKHSHATRVEVTLDKLGDGRNEALCLTVLDDGQGFDHDEVRKHHRADGGLGLHSMRERAELDGGVLTIRSSKQEGTCVKATWPLRRSAGVGRD